MSRKITYKGETYTMPGTDHHDALVTVVTAHGRVQIVPVDKIGPDDVHIVTMDDVHAYASKLMEAGVSFPPLPIAMEMADYRRLVAGLEGAKRFDPDPYAYVEPTADIPETVAPFLTALEEIEP